MNSSHSHSASAAFGNRPPKVGILRGVPSIDGVQVRRGRDRLPVEVLDPETLAGIRAEAEGEGYRDGYAAGITAGQADAQRAQAEILSRARTMIAGLAAATDQMQAREATAMADVADQVAAMAVEIAEAILHRELAHSDDAGRDALRRAIDFLPDGGAVVAHLNPTDLAQIGDVDDLLVGRDLHLVADPGVSSGGCVLQVGATRVDAQISSALDRVREVLR